MAYETIIVQIKEGIATITRFSTWSLPVNY